MEKRNISISLEKAKEWYEGGNITLRQPALEACSEEGLKEEITCSDILGKLWRSGKSVTCQTSISGIATSSMGKIKVLSKLYNIAAYFNGDRVPAYGNDSCHIYEAHKVMGVACDNCLLSSVPYFKSKEDARKAIGMLSSDGLDALFK